HHMQLLAHTDSLTRLANRRGFNDALDASLANRNEIQNLALALIDLDGFKGANDQFGHPAGDAILSEVGIRLAALSPEAICIGRIGGDEFGVILNESRACVRAAWVEKARAMISIPYQFGGFTIRISASIGMAGCQADIVSRDDWLTAADTALYLDKSDRRCRRTGDSAKISRNAAIMAGQPD
ncbi:MAG: GGDEF domain-containing protein, partial [Alphaproteobacteria bacterium]|nr:GGDEF domain-containing protein [Alphaproteobacteria bacterium]